MLPTQRATLRVWREGGRREDGGEVGAGFRPANPSSMLSMQPVLAVPDEACPSPRPTLNSPMKSPGQPCETEAATDPYADAVIRIGDDYQPGR